MSGDKIGGREMNHTEAEIRANGLNVLATLKTLAKIGEKHYERLEAAANNGKKTGKMEADSIMKALAEAFQAGRGK